MIVLDLAACLTSGQVFRFVQQQGVWEGIDGERTYRFSSAQDVVDDADARRLFRLDWDYAEVLEELCRRGPELRPFVSAAPGLRLLRPSCARETLFSFLCTSNNHLSRITAMVAKLASFGEGHRWPTLERLAALEERELRTLGFGYRAKTIPPVATGIIERGGEEWLAEASTRPYRDVQADLVQLPGIGPKLADCICLYAFDKVEAVPVDTHLWQAANFVYRLGSAVKPTQADNRRTGDFLRSRFGDLAGLAQQYLFYTNLRGLTKSVANDLEF